MIFRILTFPFRYAFSKIKKAIGKLDKIRIEPLYAFGNEECLLVKGRVVEAYRQSKPSPRKNPLQNVLGTIRRYAGSSVEGARVEVSFHGDTKSVLSDSEGIFETSFQNINTLKDVREQVSFKLVEEEGVVPEKNCWKVAAMRYASSTPVGIISDIDDTILISHATQIGRKFWLSVSKNAYTRRPFPGVSEFYEILTNGGANPLFYVSSSDWSLNDLIKDFLSYRKIPLGPLLLKDLYVNLKNVWKSGGGSHVHKQEKIDFLLKLYPGMRFVLIGDSGQHDPEIYASIIKRNPERVLLVYIRQIKLNDTERKSQMIDSILPGKVPDIVFVKNTEEAISHVKQQQKVYLNHYG